MVLLRRIKILLRRWISGTLFSEYMLGINLTVVPTFHSHLEPMAALRLDELKDQVTLSYLTQGEMKNVLSLKGPFPVEADPTR